MNIRPIYNAFVQIFRNFRHKLCHFLLKSLKFVNGSANNFIFKDGGVLLIGYIRVLWLEFKPNFSKFRNFCQKCDQTCFFWQTFFKFAGSRHIKKPVIIFLIPKTELDILLLALGFFWIYTFSSFSQIYTR